MVFNFGGPKINHGPVREFYWQIFIESDEDYIIYIIVLNIIVLNRTTRTIDMTCRFFYIFLEVTPKEKSVIPKEKFQKIPDTMLSSIRDINYKSGQCRVSIYFYELNQVSY